MELVERYRPRKIEDFRGLGRPKLILERFAEKPYASSWLLVGPSGLGKTTMGLALAETIGGQLHHIPSRQCDLATVEEITRNCHYVPWQGDWHIVLVDEADRMTKPAQHAFLSLMDSTAHPPNTVFVFTANATDTLEDRFKSRAKVIEFTADDIDIPGMLAEIWAHEALGARPPDFNKIAAKAAGNVRTAINDLEVELMIAEKPKPRTETHWFRNGERLEWSAIEEARAADNFSGISFRNVEVYA